MTNDTRVFASRIIHRSPRESTPFFLTARERASEFATKSRRRTDEGRRDKREGISTLRLDSLHAGLRRNEQTADSRSAQGAAGPINEPGITIYSAGSSYHDDGDSFRIDRRTINRRHVITLESARERDTEREAIKFYCPDLDSDSTTCAYFIRIFAVKPPPMSADSVSISTVSTKKSAEHAGSEASSRDSR